MNATITTSTTCPGDEILTNDFHNHVKNVTVGTVTNMFDPSRAKIVMTGVFKGLE